jgi:hypothetical protein
LDYGFFFLDFYLPKIEKNFSGSAGEDFPDEMPPGACASCCSSCSLCSKESSQETITDPYSYFPQAFEPSGTSLVECPPVIMVCSKVKYEIFPGVIPQILAFLILI